MAGIVVPVLAATSPQPAAGPPDPNAPAWVPAFAAFGTPKYAPGFTHFEYANPDAPKGGTLYLSNPDRRTSFDKFNPFTIKGSAPAGISLFMFETFALLSGDEPMTMYGLLAEAMRVAPDKSWIEFRLNPKARYYDGTPVTAADAKHSFELLTGKHSSPSLRTVLAGIRQASVLDERTIRFDLSDRTNDTLFIAGQLPVFSRNWGLGADGRQKRFDEIITEYPVTSGPYTIAVADSGRRIEFERDPRYWGKDLAVRRGFFNFDRVVYRYYHDHAIAMEAFKAGEFDLLLEYSARRWARQHAGPKWRDGRIVKRELRTGMGAGLQGYLFNLRRPLFQDRRVREAIDYSYDFSAINSYRQYLRTYSVFSNSQFAASGEPGPGELKLLEPYRKQLPAEVFGLPYVPPRTDTGPNALRENLRHARALLSEAGWQPDSEGVLRNVRGEPFEFEYLSPEEGASRTVATWQRNLEKLGITLKLRRVDFALYIKRLENFDFDLITIRSTDFTLPSAAELVATFGSKSADEPGGSNFRGVKSAAIDHILKTMLNAGTLPELRDATRALDRIVMHDHYQVPDLYAPTFRVSYWNKFGMPNVLPSYYTIDSPNEPLPAWPITTWWMRGTARH
jgi:peptide/nickel transport system substrate-binding protein/microcin C transport system substrate-binding protein